MDTHVLAEYIFNYCKTHEIVPINGLEHFMDWIEMNGIVLSRVQDQAKTRKILGFPENCKFEFAKIRNGVVVYRRLRRSIWDFVVAVDGIAAFICTIWPDYEPICYNDCVAGMDLAYLRSHPKPDIIVGCENP